MHANICPSLGLESRAHKAKKRKKDKKHKKHKRHRHDRLDKFDKFIQDENLSSGSSSPASPNTFGGLAAASENSGSIGAGVSGSGATMPLQFPTILGTIAGLKQERQEDDHTLSDPD